MIDWSGIESAAPTPEAVAAVSAALRSPDPVERDERAYPLLARWVPELDPAARLALGDELAERFADPEIQARTFAPLVLAKLVQAGAYRPQWLAAFARWYPAEQDLRGWDDTLGWLHAVAHGADLLRSFGLHPGADPAALLELGAARLLAPTEHVWDAMEDDRLGFALALTLTREELTEEASVAWLEPVAATFADGEPGPMPPFASNTLRTLRVLYLLADRGVRPGWTDGGVRPLRHAAAVRERVAAVLAVAAPYAG
ncbi:DUF2785 domain-containing protein [Kitasatospora cinereorecta]|uniref:DUF2785 domain-containing protein n=1 Tax=Kitasatospora cinereorecta TaxID=285560 RepID=A0ABW0VR49_9ACTN